MRFLEMSNHGCRNSCEAAGAPRRGSLDKAQTSLDDQKFLSHLFFQNHISLFTIYPSVDLSHSPPIPPFGGDAFFSFQPRHFVRNISTRLDSRHAVLSPVISHPLAIMLAAPSQAIAFRPSKQQVPWNLHAEAIKDLYLTKDKTLTDVMKIMKERWSFSARYGCPRRWIKRSE
jgi:hypothetical protein